MSGNIEYVLISYGIWTLSILVYVIQVKRLRSKYLKKIHENNI